MNKVVQKLVAISPIADEQGDVSAHRFNIRDMHQLVFKCINDDRFFSKISIVDSNARR